MEIKAFSPSKVNLFLHVLGKRPDGYHEIYTLFYATDLSDEISLSPAADNNLSCNLPTIPLDRRNIIIKVDKILRDEYGLKQNYHIKLKKNIPVGAGLGGGSGNAATYLNLVEKAASLNLSMVEKEKILARVGSDTVFFLHTPTAVASGRGEKISPGPVLEKLYILLINPGISISTKEIYTSSKLRLTNQADLPKIPVSMTVHDVANCMKNDLQPAAEEFCPIIPVLCRELEDSGALKAMMSGSGATVFGLFENENALGKAFDSMKERHPNFLVAKG